MSNKIRTKSDPSIIQPDLPINKKEQEGKKVASNVANKIINSLTLQTTSSQSNFKDKEGNDINVDKCLKLFDQTKKNKQEKQLVLKRGRKKKTKKGKFPSTVKQNPNTTVTTSSTISESSSFLFADGVQNGCLPKGFVLTSNEEDSLKNMLNFWQLGGSISLIDLLGLEIDCRYSEISESVQNIKLAVKNESISEITELQTDFEAYYFLVYISLIAENFSKQKPEMVKYLDDRFLLTRQKVCKEFDAHVASNLSKIHEILGSLDKAIKNRYSKLANTKKKYLTLIQETRKRVEAVDKLIKLCISLWASDHAVPLLIDGNIFGLCGSKVCKVREVQTGFEHLKRLVHFQKNLVRSAFKKRWLGYFQPLFEKFVENFPKELSTQSLSAIFKKTMKLMGVIDEEHMIMSSYLQDALSGCLTHEKYCLKLKIDKTTEKTQEQFVSDLWARDIGVSLIGAFTQDIHRIVDEFLMPLVSQVHMVNGIAYNRMVLNFVGYKDSLKTPSTIRASQFPNLSPLKNFNQLSEDLQKDFAQLEREFSSKFSQNIEFFTDCMKCTSEIGYYNPMLWVTVFRKLTPLIKEFFEKMLSQLTCLEKKYTTKGIEIIDQFSIANKLQAIEEFEGLLLQSSLMVCRIILFCADLRVLNGLYKFEELETEDYLLPQPLCDLLELKNLKEEVLSGLAKLVSESSSKEERSNEKGVISQLTLDEEKPKVQVKEMSEEKNSQSKEEVISPVIPITAKKIKSQIVEKQEHKDVQKPGVCKKLEVRTYHHHKKPVINIQRGEKPRKLLKKIKELLKLEPDHITGSHIIYKGGAVLPFHGGSRSLSFGTAQNLRKQLIKLSKRD